MFLYIFFKMRKIIRQIKKKNPMLIKILKNIKIILIF